MMLSPVPGSPADAPYSMNSSPGKLAPPSIDYYVEAKEKFGGMCMNDDNDSSMLLCSPSQSRPAKRNRIGTPNGKTPTSCASTAAADDDDEDFDDDDEDDESLIPTNLRMPPVNASPVPRALFSAGPIDVPSMFSSSKVKTKSLYNRQALATIPPTTCNVNPFAPEPLTRMDSMDTRSEDSHQLRRNDSIDNNMPIGGRQCPPPPPQAKRTGGGIFSSLRSMYPQKKNRQKYVMDDDSVGSLSQDSQDSTVLVKRSRETQHSAPRQRSRFQSDFEVLKAIGSGSFGTVHKVKSRLDGVLYAVKSTRAKFKSNAHRERMLAEVFALAALSNDRDHRGTTDEGSKHIVRYYQAWLEDGRLFIQTELCDSSLERELARGRVERTPKGIYKFLRQMLLALDLLHSRQLVHLDIKPGNIFINRGTHGAHYKLGDFGLVARAQRNASSPTKKKNMYDDVTEGDSRYMPRELLNETNVNDLTKCDIFSLGATTYELILATPLPANGPEWHALRDGPRPSLYEALSGNIPVSLNDIISALMRPDPMNRPNATQLLHSVPELQSQFEQLAMTLGQVTRELQTRCEPPRGHRLERSNTWC